MSDFYVYLLKSASGRDKVLGISESLAQARSTYFVPSGESFPDFVRCRDAAHQAVTDENMGLSKRIQLLLEAAGNFSSGLYFVYDNVSWGVAVGLLRGAKIPLGLQTFAVAKRGDHSGTDGLIVRLLGGSASLKRRKNFWSFYRIILMMIYEAIWYIRQAFKPKGQAMSFTRTYVAAIHASQTLTLIFHFWLLSTRLFRSSLPRLLLLSEFRMAMLSIAANVATVVGSYFRFQLMLQIQHKQQAWEKQQRKDHELHKSRSQILRQEEEFAAQASPSKQQVMLMSQLKGSLQDSESIDKKFS